MTDLLPCPFCGSDAKLIDGRDSAVGVFVRCEYCRLDYSSLATAEKAAALWNSRAVITTPAQSVRVWGPTQEDMVAKAVMLDDGCGLTINGQRVLCDDPRIAEPYARCFCRKAAKAALSVAAQPPAATVESVGMTYNTISAAFDEYRKTLTVMDKRPSFDSFSQGYVAGWNAKEAQPHNDSSAATEDTRPVWQQLQLGLLLGMLSDWRNADHEDSIRLGRSDVIAIIDGFKARPTAQPQTARNAAIEECAKVCDDLRHEDYSAETSDWSGGTFDCARAIRALALSRPQSRSGE